MTTTASTHLSEDVYTSYIAAKRAHLVHPDDAAAKATYLDAEATLATELLAFAKRVIYAKYGDNINRFDPEVVIQDAGTELYQQLCHPESMGNGNGGFSGKSSLSTWGWKVVNNHVLKHFKELRRFDRLPEGPVHHSAPSPFEAVARDEIINSLNDAQRTVFTGKTEGLTGHEIAQKQGVVDSTIDYRWKMARKKIRRSRTGRRSGCIRGRVEPQNLTLKDRENVRKSSVK